LTVNATVQPTVGSTVGPTVRPTVRSILKPCKCAIMLVGKLQERQPEIGSALSCQRMLAFLLYFAPGRGPSIAISVSVCLSVWVCLSAVMSQKQHVQTSGNFLYMLPVVMARSLADDNAIPHVLPVLWMTSCFHIMDQRQIQAWNLPTPFPSNRHHRSNGDCLEGKRENYQVCSVQYCVQQLCTVQCTHTHI